MQSVLNIVQPSAFKHQSQTPNISKTSVKRNNDEVRKRIRRSEVEKIYTQLQLQQLSDFFQVPPFILSNLNKPLMQFYDFNLSLLLKDIYPNYPWKSSSTSNHDMAVAVQNNHIFAPISLIDLKNAMLKRHSKKYYERFQHRRKYLDDLFQRFEFESLDDWFVISPKRLSHIPSFRNVLSYYDGSLLSLLTSIYPNYPWFNLSSHQGELITQRVKQSTSSAFLSSSSEKLKSRRGGQRFRFSTSSFFQSSMENRRLFMSQLYHHLNYESFEDWRSLSRQKLLSAGGFVLLKLYSFSLPSLLTSIFPNYPWHVNHHNQVEIDDHYPSTMMSNSQNISQPVRDKLRNQFEVLFCDFQLQNLEDWCYLPRSLLYRHPNAASFSHYCKPSLRHLLSTLYPNFPLFHHPFPVGTARSPSELQHFHHLILRVFRKRFGVQRKSDWFRIPRLEVDIRRSLLEIYPLERWPRSAFQTRNKKSQQRLLFISTMKQYPHYLILENYRHPLLSLTDVLNRNNEEVNVGDVDSAITPLPLLEYDIFLPAINYAIEYQGEQHFNDIPAFFNFHESYVLYDERKRIIARKHGIHLVQVPFWWDH